MKKLKVKASAPYNVYVGEDALDRIIEIFNEDLIKVPNKILIVSDSNVYPLYGEKVKGILDGYAKTYSFVFDAGEQSKTLSTAQEIIACLASNEFTRSDLIIALGGGVVGDVTGFVAGIYLRGVAFVQVPTTLLAAIDSSVGGKTGVDIPEGKNLVGVFNQPKAVICDTKIIKNLPEDIFAQGMAEAIKYGVIRNKKLFEKIEDKTISVEDLIYACVKIKADIVRKDEFDNGERQLLNLGHTFGHAVEKLSNFTISHGEGVAIGMVLAAKFAYLDGTAKKDITNELISALEKVGLPVKCGYDADEMIRVMALDKKRRGNYINLILPESIGNSIIKKYPINEFGEIFKKL